MIGTDFLSLLETIIIMGSASAKEIIPPCNHHTKPGMSIFTITIDTKKYCTKAERVTFLSSFLITIGIMSITPAMSPITIDISNVAKRDPLFDL